ncbi:YihY/virulence factor BrkB family protein [Demequina sp. NBRC 110053]|uniref:YihY/virulence factor BrkB family protein n=1 Tax=Demequina sp. NBRC 110053 TaxID=1570342 RepID=UPI000A01CBD5|nr:YihY/virulence factor BrkB family protein [Demequina sp. NBRC 110053]
MAGDDASLTERGKSAVAKAKTLKERFDATHAGRTLERYNDRNGSVIAGGIAFFSLTSIAAGLLIAVTLASWFIAGDEELRDTIFEFIDDAIPGVVATEDESGLVDPAALAPTAVTGVVGAVAFLILFNTAARYISGMRMGVWAMLQVDDRTPLQGKLRDFAALLGIALMVLLGVGLQIATSVVANEVANLLFDSAPQEWAVRLSGIAVLYVVDMAFAAIVLVFLGGVRLPRRYVLTTLAVAALGMAVLRQVMSLIIQGVSDNAVLAPFAGILTLLLFTNYTARIMLYSAAFLGTYRRSGPLAKEELSPAFAAFVRDDARASITEAGTGVVTIDTGPRHPDLLLERDSEDVVSVSLAPVVGEPWSAMRSPSLRAAERYAALSLASIARDAHGVEGRLVVHSARDLWLPDVTMAHDEDSEHPFVLLVSGEELARFSRASDAREAAVYLAAPIEELTQSILEPDGGALLGTPDGGLQRIGDRVRSWLRR